MANNVPNSDLANQAREVLEAAAREAGLLRARPDLLAAYAGEWIAVHNGQVIAHTRDGAELAKTVNVHTCPDAVIRYVPTAEEQSGVFILALLATGGQQH